MSIRLQLVDHRSNALPAGLGLTLLRNGEEIAKGITDAEGVVSFEVDAEGREGLSVRLDAWEALQKAVASVMTR